MAIRQLTFEQGQRLEVKNKASRFAPDEVLEKMDEYLRDEKTLIIKCGKSFWNVTAYPEIFEQGEEFDPKGLTSIDLKQMQKPTPPKPAYEENPNEDTKRNLMRQLFHKSDEVNSEDETQEEESKKRVRKTYYLNEIDVEALAILCYYLGVEVSAMVREIFERGLTSIAEEIEYPDLFEEAKRNLDRRGSLKNKSFKKTK